MKGTSFSQVGGGGLVCSHERTTSMMRVTSPVRPGASRGHGDGDEGEQADEQECGGDARAQPPAPHPLRAGAMWKWR